jgi:predicted RNA binding protein YcfA (HicA-like mRNA interferase family)
MAKLPVVSGRETVRALGRVGYRLDRQRGSHLI